MTSHKDFFVTKMQETIDKCTNISDLSPMLSMIPLNMVKDFMKTYIDSLDIDEYGGMYYNSISIADCLGLDVVQYILSFNIPNEISTVNKLFKHLSINNETNACKNATDSQKITYCKLKQQQYQLSATITKLQNTVKCLYEKKSLITEKMDNLSKDIYNALKHEPISSNTNISEYDEYFCPQKTIKYIESYNETHLANSKQTVPLQTIIAFSKSGDKIQIKSGIYKKKGESFDSLKDDLQIQNKNLQIIGIGSSPTFVDYHGFILRKSANVYVENITFQIDFFNGFKVESGSSLWLNRCKFVFTMSGCIEAAPNSNIYVKNCSFIGEEDQRDSAISIDPFAAKANIINCRFVHCGEISGMGVGQLNGEFSCIEIEEYNKDEIEELNRNNMVLLNCIGNRFIDNFGFPVAKKYTTWKNNNYQRVQVPNWFNQYNQNERHCVFKYNVLEDVNGKGKVDEKGNVNLVKNANKLYQHYYNKDMSKMFG